MRERAIHLVRSTYPDFGPTLAAEMLAERHDLKVSRETLRGWMAQAGLWLSRKQRRRFHQPRPVALWAWWGASAHLFSDAATAGMDRHP